MSKFLRNIKKKYFARSKKISTFANDDDDEPTALAFTDFTKPSPILKGKDAERFIKNMEEAEKMAEENASIPKSKERLEKELHFKKWIYDFEKRKLKDLEQEIKELEKELNGKTEEE